METRARASSEAGLAVIRRGSDEDAEAGQAFGEGQLVVGAEGPDGQIGMVEVGGLRVRVEDADDRDAQIEILGRP